MHYPRHPVDADAPLQAEGAEPPPEAAEPAAPPATPAPEGEGAGSESPEPETHDQGDQEPAGEPAAPPDAPATVPAAGGGLGPPLASSSASTGLAVAQAAEAAGPPTVAPVTDPGGTPVSRPGRTRNRRWLRVVIEWAVIILVVFGAAVLVRAFVFQTYYIPSGSMEPTLQIGDRILVDKLSYHLHAVHRGDIVVFRRPPTETADLVPDLVKRVIGLPGETISGQGGNVYINGKLLPEPWLPQIDKDTTSNFGPIKIPQGDYFVMGDNRTVSYDSRAWGPLPRSYIVGRVVMRIWPVSRINFF